VRTQVRVFGEALPLDGLVLTKYDSSARGGTAVGVARELGVPVRWLGTGEDPGDLERFDPERYVERLLG
jgi:signal recognition particle GTPase